MSLKNLVGIIDYGMGNIKSVQKALSHIGVESKVIDNPTDMQEASHLILPGVGSFGEAVKNLHERGLFEALKQWKKPLICICLGMQLLAESSEESPGVEGLGLIKGRVIKLKSKKLPHVGWEIVDTGWGDDNPSDDYYYFVHSYAVEFHHPKMSYSLYDNHYFLAYFNIGNL